MARLRYNNFRASLGGSGLTTSGTAITFAVAPTYGNGTALPTIAAPDFLPLSLMDSTNGTFEVVYLTAYTTGGTSGTILRGQEGSAGIAHNAGDRVLHGPTVTEIARLDASVKPAALHATLGDDFSGGSLDAKWTRVTYTAGDEAYAQGGDASWLQVDTQRAVGSYYWQAVSGLGDFVLQMGMVAYRDISQMFGLLAVNSSGDGVGCTPYSNPEAWLTTSISGLSYGGSSSNFGHGFGYSAMNVGEYVHIQLRRVGTNWSSRISMNGRVWSPWTSTVTGAQTITRVGFGGWFASTPPFAVDYFTML